MRADGWAPAGRGPLRAGWGAGLPCPVPPPSIPWPPGPRARGGRGGTLPGHRRGPVPARFLLPPAPGGLPAPPPCSRAPSLLFPPRAAASSSSSASLSLSICLSRPGIHSGPGAGAARPPCARAPGRPAVRPQVRLSVRCVRLPAGPGERPPPRRRPRLPARVTEPPGRGPPWRPIAGPRGAPAALQPSPLGPSGDPGALGGRSRTCLARPFVVMPRGGGGWVGGVGVLSARGSPSRSPSVCGPPESSEPGLSPQAGSRPNLKSEPVGAASGRRCPAWRPQPGMEGGEGPAGWAWGAGQGMPGQDTRTSLSSRGLG